MLTISHEQLEHLRRILFNIKNDLATLDTVALDLEILKNAIELQNSGTMREILQGGSVQLC